MASIVNLLILAVFASIIGAAPAARGVGNYGKFSDYCMYPMYIDKEGTSVATFDADCSSKKGGASPGKQLASSQLDLNDCFINAGGRLMPFKGGKAMESCTCNIGYSVCGNNCPNTAMQCQCKNIAGDLVTGDRFDIGDYIGVVWSEEHKSNLLVCAAPSGDTVAEYQGCIKNGVTRNDAECPS